MDTPKKRPLIIHGHFYQPPREHPWTQRIPIQPTAKPFKNWNERIHKECYESNTCSAYLDAKGNVLKRYNNYAYLSFNFGPTLIDWLVKHHPATFEAIVAGDKESIARTGYGNAIAQGYNHTIVPLNNQADRELQIYWGIEHFHKHFHRTPKSLWLPETAIDAHTVDTLIAAGISYVILSPWQASSYINEQGESIVLEGSAIASFEPYEIEGTRGSLTAMFYHPDLASEISFGGILFSADVLYNRLLEISQAHTGLIHTATDGEIYGHHFRLGNMCLAALIEKVEQGDAFTFTNYAAYLAEHKPTKKAILRKGEDNKGSSWSCAHGVSRWYKDCGCSTGGKEGWNQTWRTPLRDGFNAISNHIKQVQHQEIPKLTHIPIDQLLQKYVHVLAGDMSAKQFAEEHAQIKSSSDQFTLCALLEGEIHRMYSFTSCGWFFAELTDITSTQNIRHALRAIEFYQPYATTDLVAELKLHLRKAKSNLPQGLRGDQMVDEILAEPKV